jgi:hypothetical protein
LDSDLTDLDVNDFRELLRLVLYEDTYLFKGESRRQTTGIAMGNCAAPPLAIIYMDHVERKIIDTTPALLFWKRYIDDVFYITSSTSEELLLVANSINHHIQFTLEKPVGNKISFLDTLVHVDNGRISFQLFIKPTHSGTCLPYDAHVPLSRKKCLVSSENIRLQRIASEDHVSFSKEMIHRRFLQNGYPRDFFESTVRSINYARREQPDFITFVNVPFMDEAQRRLILQLRRRTGLNDKVRVIFTTERPLAWQFRPKREIPACPTNCMACATSERPAACCKKNAVYLVTCQLCRATYVGQTERTMRSRILEHAQTQSSHVNQHMITHGSENSKKFTWKVIASHPYTSTRLAIEALFIKRQSQLMNGCEGAHLLNFL